MRGGGAAVLQDSFGLKGAVGAAQRPSVPAKKSLDRHESDTSPLSRSDAVDSYLCFCGKSKILVVPKEAGSERTVVVKTCPLVSVALFHQLTTLNCNL